MPELNLVPMIDVLMTILTFFIIITMTLVVEQGIEVELPGKPDGNAAPPTGDAPKPLLVKVQPDGLLVNDQPTSADQVEQQAQSYLQGDPRGLVVVQSAPEMPYEEVLQLLSNLKELDGDRVVLAID